MPQNDKVILLVEDNEDDVFFMKRALKTAGITNPLFIVEDGEQAIQYLSGAGQYANREEFPYPDLVLLDLKLPYMSGLEVLEWRRAQKDLAPNIVIVITSSNEPFDLNSAYRLGASSYVVKPPTGDQLIEIANSFRLYWLQYNQFPTKA